MRIFQEVINYPADSSFLIKYDDFPHFTVPWHFHNEYEIVFIIKSFGKKIVGDSVEEFGPGDLSIYGSKLPHFYMNNLSNFNRQFKGFIGKSPSEYRELFREK